MSIDQLRLRYARDHDLKGRIVYQSQLRLIEKGAEIAGEILQENGQ